MTSSVAAAFHHAGHAVTAHFSRFHSLVLPLRTDVYGTGEITAALSRKKLVAASKVPSVTARTDPDVAASIVTILCAGFAAEELAATRGYRVQPDPARSAGDFRMARAELEIAKMSEDLMPFQRTAGALLAEHWAHVQKIAERLEDIGELSPIEIAGLIAQT